MTVQRRVIALGFFDGVHLGHGGLLRRTRQAADALGLPAAALTFDVHPDTLVRGATVPLLSTPDDRAALMQRLYGIDEVLTLHFDRETMVQPWENFVEETLVGRFHAAHVVCGHDYRFGARGLGTPQRLQSACAARSLGFDCIPEIRIDGQTVSSTRIRDLLARGEMTQAVRFLGHPHLLRGTVVGGRRIGRTIGIPTANLEMPPELLLPARGVYAARAYFDGQERLAVVNIGLRPTVGGETVTVEPWLLDFDGNLYGHTLCLALYEFLRPEQKFPTLTALKTEIEHNAAQTREFFK